MDKMRALKYFIEVARTGSFTGAAKSLGVPASSISRRIQDLETELGVTLVHRTTRVVKLTEIGTLYLDQIQPALTALSYAEEVITAQSDMLSGRLRITSTPGYGGYCVMPVLNKLRERYPDLVIDIELTDQVSNLSNNDVDLAIRTTAELPERAVARKLSDNNFILVASPSYIKKMGCPQSLADINNHKTLLYRGPNGILNWQAKTETGWIDLHTSAGFISNKGETLVTEVVAGTGLALIPDWGAEVHLANKKLVKITLDDATLSISRNTNLGIYLLYHKPKYSLKKIKITVDFLVAALSN